ncbi:MAG: hypothetical protein HFJ51_01090 [Clostridia bacterium]|nr:hypothetical protein [Clostridia bacterium]
MKKEIKNKKAIVIVICFILSLFLNTLSIAATNINITSKLSEETGVEKNVEGSYEHFELRAVDIKETEGGNRQLIMELWGNDIEFKRI